MEKALIALLARVFEVLRGNLRYHQLQIIVAQRLGRITFRQVDGALATAPPTDYVDENLKRT
jgi:hypothetical protein